MKQIRIILIMTALISAGMTAQAKKVLLRYNLESGTSFTIVHTKKQEIAQEIMGQSQIITNTTTTTFQFKVLEKNSEGNYLIEEQIKALKFKMDSDFMNMDYDSDRDKEAPADLSSVVSIINVPVKILLSPMGEILELLDTEKYLEIVKQAMGGEANPMSQMVSGATSQMTSAEGLKNQLSSFFFNYPEEKQKIGDSWTSESESMQMVKFMAITESALVEADKEKAVIKQAVKFEQMELAEGMEMEGMTMNYELSGRREAGHQLEVKTGLVSKVDAVTEISGIMSIESPQLPTPMSIPMTIKVTETVERVK